MAEVIVIGGGAAGMAAAIAAARGGKTVMLLEHNRVLGKKVAVTGNGKCNFTNAFQSMSCYRSDTPELAWNIINQFPMEETVRFFEELGLVPEVKKGYFYPASGQGQAVAELLTEELLRLGVKCKTNAEVTAIEIEGEDFLVRTPSYTYRSHYCVIAAGGSAAPVHGTDGAGFRFAAAFGHSLAPQYPALVQLRTEERFVQTLAGLHVAGKISLYIGEGANGDFGAVTQESGELLFTAYGISGIPVLQLSRFAAKALGEGKHCTLVINLADGMEAGLLRERLNLRIDKIGYKNGSSFLKGWFPEKLAKVLLQNAGIRPESAAECWTETERAAFVLQCTSFRLRVCGTNGYEQAQTTAGGVLLGELTDGLESRLVPRLYFVGEVADVDGTCGGYNLQWAWSSGILAGCDIAKSGSVRAGMRG